MEATLKKKENYTWKFVKKPGNIMEFCHSGKMGTLYYVLVGGKKDKHMVGNVDTLILITRGQYITMRSNTRVLYIRWINNTLSPFFKKNDKNKTM